MKMKKILLLTIVLAFTLASKAQTKDKKWGIGLNFGSEQYNGDWGNGFYDFDQAFNPFGGITVSRYLSPHLDLSLQSSLGEIGYKDNSKDRFKYNMFQFNLNLKYSFFKYENVRIRPFVFAGLGHMVFTDKRSDKVINNMQLPDFGLGLSFKVSPTVSIVLQETFMYSDYDKVDYIRKGSHDSYVQHSIGIMFNLGKKKDSDRDGIPDRKDECPELTGLKAFNGCPDTDSDGIPDKDDQCPNERGLKEFNGCPDTDGDGVPDKDDQCPNEKGTKALNGCADSDGDGIADKDDQCPYEKGPKALNGCPDTDGDGIVDKDDKCPTVAGIAKNKGCPEIKASEVKALEKAINGIKFKTGKALITNDSRQILNNVVSILKANPAYKLRIEGHTDSQGSDDLNLRLSKQRAKAIKDYFETSDIKPGRLSSTGYGEARPIADNKTAAGRAKNRRVELIIKF